MLSTWIRGVGTRLPFAKTALMKFGLVATDRKKKGGRAGVVQGDLRVR